MSAKEDKLIDEMYTIYKNHNLAMQEACFMSKYNEENVSLIEEYANKNAMKLSNYFASIHKKKNEQNELRKLMFAFNSLAEGVNNVIFDRRVEDFEQENAKKYNPDADVFVDYDEISYTEKDLFSIKKDILIEAYKKYASEDITEEGFNKILNLLSKIKKDNAIKKVISNNFDTMSFDDIIYRLFDYYNKDEELFSTELIGDVYLYADSKSFDFTTIGEDSSSIDFDKYRSSLISKKTCDVDVDKLAFARNLLQYYKTGVIPDVFGVVDITSNDEEKKDLIKEFKQNYSVCFDDEEFKEQQSNFVLNEKLIPVDASEICSIKYVRRVNSLVAGVLFRKDLNEHNIDGEILSLLHIHIDDITKNSKYEIQYNVFPCSKFDARIQLLRLDGYTQEGVHRNINLKLKTTTHLHKYNQFDILRGRVNGNYDIAQNLEKDVSKFEDSLDYFLDLIITNNKKLKSKIINKIENIIEEEKKIIAEISSIEDKTEY